MASDLACSDIIHVAHHAAGDPSLWDTVAARLSEQLRASAVAFVDHNIALGQGNIAHAAGIPRQFRYLYHQRFGPQNAWLNTGLDFAAGRCVTGAELVANWELARTAFYRDWLRPQNLHHAILGILSRHDGKMSCLLGLRPLDSGPFDAGDKERLGALLPELRCAYELGFRFTASRSRAEMMRDALQALPEAIFIVERDGYAVFANGAAEALLRQQDGLTIAAGLLTAGSSHETRELRQLLQATAIGAGQAAAGGEMLLSRPSGAPPLIVRLAPLAHAVLDDSGRASAVALVFVRQIDSPDAVQRLCGYYRMTPSEARLAALILRGHSLLAAASELRITKNTARTHMKRIYLKTATHRQADLIRLLASGDPPPTDAAP